MALPLSFARTTVPACSLTDAQLSSIEVEEDGKSESDSADDRPLERQHAVRVEGAPRAVDHGATPPRAPVGRGRISPGRDLGGARARMSGLPVATSVWHRPLVPEEAKDRLAKRQANAAVALLQA